MKTQLLRGNNWLRLSPTTMQAVVQAWLDEELASSVEVLDVRYDSATSAFEVRLKRTEGETQA